MRPTAFVCTVLFGVLLHAAVMVLAGVAAAIVVPPSYFAWFGRAHGGLALALLDLTVFALPAAVVNAGGVLAAHRMLRASTWPVLLGYLVCWLYTVAESAFMLLAASEGALSPTQALRSVVPGWWALPGLLLPWLGFAAAAWLLRDRTAAPR